jgi:hypothetical protein
MTRKTWAVAAAGLCASGACAQQLPANVRCVRNGAPAGGDGRSWAAAWPELQEALLTASASGGEITEVWVAQGEYAPPAWNACVRFPVSNVSLYGGFAGAETSVAQRPAGARSTLREAFYTCGSSVTGLLNISTTAPVVVDGFFVTAGGYTANITVAGAARLENIETGYGYQAISKTDSAPIFIRSCHFELHQVNGPPSVWINGPGVIEDSFLWGAPYFGWGVHVSDLTIRNSTVRGGTETAGLEASNVVFQNCFVRGWSEFSIGLSLTGVTFDGCRVEADGYGRACIMSGGSIRRSTFWGRSYSNVPAVRLSGVVLNDSTVDVIGEEHVELQGASTFVNTRFIGGGSHGMVGGSGAAPQFINCLFQHSGWPSMFEVGPQWRFDNCIIWGSGTDDATTFNAPVGMTGFVNYCDVRGWSGALGGIGNISVDPLLNTDGTLRWGSPCIDAGDNSRVPPGAVYDFVRGCRIVDGDVNGSRVVDMGPHEFTLCAANCDCSTGAPVLNVLDFNCFLHRFSVGDPWANCDRSTEAPVLNVLDFNCFVQRFTAGCP